MLQQENAILALKDVSSVVRMASAPIAIPQLTYSMMVPNHTV
jgi:hypothetical protein